MLIAQVFQKTMTARGHNNLFGIFLLVNCLIVAVEVIIWAKIAIFILTEPGAWNGPGPPVHQMFGQMLVVILVVSIPAIAIAGIILAIPQILGSLMLFIKSPSAQTWGVVASTFALICFPIGTAVGIYGLWFLLSEKGKRFYSNT